MKKKKSISKSLVRIRSARRQRKKRTRGRNTQKRNQQQGGAATDSVLTKVIHSDEAPTVGDLTRRIFVNAPLLLAEKAISEGEAALGIDGSNNGKDIHEHIANASAQTRKLLTDPRVVDDVRAVLDQSGDILIDTAKDVMPEVAKTAVFSFTAIPFWGNIASIFGALTTGAVAGSKFTVGLSNAGLVSLDTVAKVQNTAQRLQNIIDAGDNVRGKVEAGIDKSSDAMLEATRAAKDVALTTGSELLKAKGRELSNAVDKTVDSAIKSHPSSVTQRGGGQEEEEEEEEGGGHQEQPWNKKWEMDDETIAQEREAEWGEAGQEAWKHSIAAWDLVDKNQTFSSPIKWGMEEDVDIDHAIAGAAQIPYVAPIYARTRARIEAFLRAREYKENNSEPIAEYVKTP